MSEQTKQRRDFWDVVSDSLADDTWGWAVAMGCVWGIALSIITFLTALFVTAALILHHAGVGL